MAQACINFSALAGDQTLLISVANPTPVCKENPKLWLSGVAAGASTGVARARGGQVGTLGASHSSDATLSPHGLPCALSRQ